MTKRVEKNNNNGDLKQDRYCLRSKKINLRVIMHQMFRNLKAVKELVEKGELPQEELDMQKEKIRFRIT